MNWKAIAIRLARVICRANRDWREMEPITDSALRLAYRIAKKANKKSFSRRMT